MRPMLATRGDHVPTGPDWVHEVKWDGMRVIVEVTGGRARLTSRNGNDVTSTFPELSTLALPDLVLDGEVVAFTDGRPDFGALATRLQRSGRGARMRAEVVPVTLLVFDLLRLGEQDLRGLPLSERRELLDSLHLGDDQVQVPPTYDDGQMLLEATRAQELEGIVSKRLASRYEEGVRSRSWLKFAHRSRTSWVVGGWRHETGSPARIGAVLVGEPTADGFRYRGRVGSGITGRTGVALKELLVARAADASPFDEELPRADALGTHWVRPEVVVDVESLGFSANGRLRQPSFRGVRVDLTPADLLTQSREADDA
ncbi:non-homologous end-joining DNA ligase [Nocardioides jishulii]|uniref:DNA ligase (ATP) n=1 Tax=Nocardioides jishulii TaxID=2575440 RepID=A0A4U2YL27_9ACTN|nr:non-homologous end-joining DNA ligase [Nocardioides jishulii]QCX26791.1 DNA ligase [Nocardioides jishulii]TKI61275.1 DNA ligase [Nocardioides jishulii]